MSHRPVVFVGSVAGLLVLGVLRESHIGGRQPAPRSNLWMPLWYNPGTTVRLEQLADSSFGEPLDQVVVAMSSNKHREALEHLHSEAWS